MANRPGPHHLIRIIVAAIALISIALLVPYALSYLGASFSSQREIPSQTVRNERIVVAFSSERGSYVPGENATFYISILNRQQVPIRRVDFSLSVRASSLFGVEVTSASDHSDRTFEPGRLETIVVKRYLPSFLPPGFYTLRLSAKALGSEPPLQADIVVYLMPSIAVWGPPLAGLLAGVGLYVVMAMGARTRAGVTPRYVVLRNVRLLGSRIDATDERFSSWVIGVYASFSVGQKLVFFGICVLMSTLIPLTAYLESYANDLAVVAFLLLAVGVTNLVLEMRVKPADIGFRGAARMMLSLTVVGILTYSSNKILAIAVLSFPFYIAADMLRRLRK
jgi:hypothetical protein